jgi:hypothetical protein
MSAANNGAAVLAANLLYKGPLISDIQMAPFTGCAAVNSTTTWTCDVNPVMTELVAGGTVYILANKFQSTASTPVANAATTATITADTTLPTLTGATFSQSATGGTQASVTVGGDVTLSARAATSGAGRAGNAVDVQTVVNPALDTAPTCVYTASTNTVTISAATTTSALVLANACNTTSSFNALFSASATTAGGLSGYAAAVLDMTGGADKVTTTLTFSEALGAAADGNFTFTNGTGAAITAAAATDAGRLTGVLTVTYLTTTAIIGSVDTVSVATAVTDRVGNAIAASTSKVLTPA